jgi:hypothetical protein
VASDEKHHAITVFVIGMYPHIVGTRRANPMSMRPNPVALPDPVSADPNRVFKRRWRWAFDEQRRGRPADGNRLRLGEWRFYVHTYDGARRRRYVNLRRTCNYFDARWCNLRDAASQKQRDGNGRDGNYGIAHARCSNGSKGLEPRQGEIVCSQASPGCASFHAA